jgi:hypothetical protein
LAILVFLAFFLLNNILIFGLITAPIINYLSKQKLDIKMKKSLIYLLISLLAVFLVVGTGIATPIGGDLAIDSRTDEWSGADGNFADHDNGENFVDFGGNIKGNRVTSHTVLHAEKEGNEFSATGLTASVPEPATMLMLGTGLIVLAGVGRKRLFK